MVECRVDFNSETTRIKMHTVQELEAFPTISRAQCDDLKIETPTERVWLSRMTPDDGEIFQIHHESLIDGRWVVTSEYAPFAT